MAVFLSGSPRGATTERTDELLTELDGQWWDAVLINETMRSTDEEYWITLAGNIFCGSGHDQNNRGVAILLHKR